MAEPDPCLICVVSGAVFTRYAATLVVDAEQNWPGRFFVVHGYAGWPQASSRRYQVILEHEQYLPGSHLFMIDADSRILKPITAADMCVDGLTVTTHPGFPAGSDPDECPFERNPQAKSYVPYGSGSQYHPGAFVGGERSAFLDLCRYIAGNVDEDLRTGVHPTWYDESYLNRYLVDHPPALVLDRRYCWWHNQWGPTDEAIIMHLDKTQDEFDETRRPPDAMVE